MAKIVKGEPYLDHINHFHPFFNDFDWFWRPWKRRKVRFEPEIEVLLPFDAILRHDAHDGLWKFEKKNFFSVILNQKKICTDTFFLFFLKKIGEKKACFTASKIW